MYFRWDQLTGTGRDTRGLKPIIQFGSKDGGKNSSSLSYNASAESRYLKPRVCPCSPLVPRVKCQSKGWDSCPLKEKFLSPEGEILKRYMWHYIVQYM